MTTERFEEKRAVKNQPTAGDCPIPSQRKSGKKRDFLTLDQRQIMLTLIVIVGTYRILVNNSQM